MSHYIVAVFSREPDEDTIDSLLAPYCEQPTNPEYLAFKPLRHTMDELHARFEKYKDTYESFEEFLSEQYGAHYDEDRKVWGYECNPQGYWDWYQFGGRWSGALRLKDGAEGRLGTTVVYSPQLDDGGCDQALVRDVDFSPRQDEYEAAARFWEVVVEGSPRRPEESEREFWTIYRPEWFRERYQTKEEYASAQAAFSTYAFVTADGEWIAKGEMGYFGCGTETRESIQRFQVKLEQYIAEHPDLYITMVDCHI